MAPRLWIDELTFKDGNFVKLGSDDVVVIVGPNNAGKSATLRAIRDRLQTSNDTPVIAKILTKREGTLEEVTDWLTGYATIADKAAADPTFQAFGRGLTKSQLSLRWSNQNLLHDLSRFFCHLLTADERLSAANAAPGIAILSAPRTHPIHYLVRDSALEQRLSDQFFRAFGVDLVLDRAAGAQFPLRVGLRPKPKPGQDRLDPEYMQELDKLPLLQGQGDGMRSFAGVLLNMSVGQESLLLVDEPEAFLHPPQARQLGKMIVMDKSENRQLFVATHSGDILRGVLDSGRSNVRVMRVRRAADKNYVRLLENSRIKELWSDPLLRYSNILDGLFHEKVVVCEGDVDARFYSAVADAMFDSQKDSRRPDVMFTHCGGKDRMALVVRALREVDVPVAIAVDFDVLNSDQPLRSLVEAAGGSWADVSGLWKLIKDAVDSKKPELGIEEVKGAVTAALAKVKDATSLKDARESAESAFRRSSPWATAKTTGRTFIPSGEASQAFVGLMAALQALGIFVVEEGEVESFVRTVGNHGPKWVNEALKLDLAGDPSLDSARKYVVSLIS